MALREAVIPRAEGDYSLVAGSVGDVDALLEAVEADRAAVVVFRGPTTITLGRFQASTFPR